MRWFQPSTRWASLLTLSSLFTSSFPSGVVAIQDHVIGTRSLKPCMANSGITATFIDVSFHTNTSTLHFDINAYSTISGKVQVLMTVYAYGFKAFTQEFDPCQRKDWTQLCPMSPQPIQVNSNQDLGSDLVSQIPAIAYQVPDLDAYVRIQIVSADAQKTLLGCVDAQLSNGVTVEKGAVSWVTAFVGGGALLWAAIVISCSNPTLHYYHLTTAKFAAYSLALYTFMQSQALIGMTSVPLPPIVSAWTQNFVWAVGIVEMNFMQKFFHWYIRSTGGHISSLFNQISTTSVLVMKRDLSHVRRSLEVARGIERNALRRRAVNDQSTTQDPNNYHHIMVKGIERVAFKAGIEQTNLFLTSYSMYIIFAFVVVAFFLAFRGIVELMVKKQKMGMQNKLVVFRQNWRLMLKRVALCLIIMGYPALIALSLWELTMRDSPAVLALAVVIFLAMTGLIAVTVFRLYMLLRRTGVMPFSAKGPLARFSTKSADMEKPASTSWRDSAAGLSESKVTASRDLKQFVLLTIPYRRSGAYWVLPLMLFVFTKSALVGLSQQHLYDAPSEDESSVGTIKGIAQAIGFLIIDLLWLIGVAWVRPWMDKPTNILGIASAVMGLLNGICLLIFTEAVSGQAKPAKPIVGVLFVLFNIIMSLILLIVTIVSTIYAIIDWKKGHPAPSNPKIDSAVIVSAEDYANHNMTSTPDPFLPATHGNDTLPTHPNSRSLSHVFSEDGRASASTFGSRDIAAMQPTEPNMSTTSFNGNGRGTGVIVTAPTTTDNTTEYPLQNINTNHSTQSPLGVVIISSGKSEDGRSTYAESSRSASSRGGARPTGNQHLPPNPPFSRQDSRLSQRSMNSIHSQRSFSRPGPVQGVYAQGSSANPSQASVHKENTPSKTETVESGMAI